MRQEPSSANPSGNTKSAVLAAGALLGILLAGSGLFSSAGKELPASAIANVNGELISKTEYLELLAAMTADKRGPVSADDRHKLLSRLVEEKLLIGRGVEIGLPWSDPGTSRAIVDTMIDIALSEARNQDPDEASLQAFFQAHRNYFQRPAQLHVRRMVFRGNDALERAREALQRLQEEPWSRLAAELADPASATLPESTLSATRLPGYLGQSQADIVLALESGSWSGPVPAQAGFDILWLVDRIPAATPDYSEIREQVRHEYLRRASDAALRAYLEQLRGAARIDIDRDFLNELDGSDVPAP